MVPDRQRDKVTIGLLWTDKNNVLELLTSHVLMMMSMLAGLGKLETGALEWGPGRIR